MLRDHSGSAVEFQREADSDVGGDGGGADCVEGVAGGAREEFAVASESGRPRGDRVEHLFGYGEFRGLQRGGEGVERLALVGGGLPFHWRAAVAANAVDVILPADH